MIGAGRIDVRHPRHYEGIFGPPAEVTSLPPWCYTAPEFLEAESSAVFPVSWVCLGRLDQFPAAGAYKTRRVAGRDLILVRGGDGRVRALGNACRHRGTRLLDGQGTTPRIRCPFHNWTYSLDGTLLGAPDIDDTKRFRREDNGLTAFATDTWNGFIFVRLAGDGPSLGETLTEATEALAPYRLDEMVVTRTDVFRVRCNWKLFLDVFMEDYHLKAVHGASVAGAYFKPDPPDRFGDSVASIWNPHEGTSALLAADMAEHALPPIAGLQRPEAAGTRYIWMFPSLAFAVTVDSLWFFEVDPVEPGVTEVAMHMCFPKSTTTRNDFAAKAERYYARWRMVIGEDNAVLTRQQQGMASGVAQPGRYSHLEPVPSLFAQWLACMVVGRSTIRSE